MLEALPEDPKEGDMGYATSKDGTKIFYKDWGTGSPVVFSHGWPLSGDAWDPHMHFMASNVFRTVAHHRRGMAPRASRGTATPWTTTPTTWPL